jgi:hypothetical protein
MNANEFIELQYEKRFGKVVGLQGGHAGLREQELEVGAGESADQGLVGR